MDKIVIEGGKRLVGTIKMSGAKNAVLPVLAATLLTEGRNVIDGVPEVRDVQTMIKILEALGAKVESYSNEKIILDTSKINNSEAPYDLVSTMRASCMVLGPLLARLGKARVSLPGGCAIGARPIDLHIKGLQAMGAKVWLEQGYVHGEVDHLKGISF
jgi:UDP-N-acetylglucosamine 1-carboxyvinyltransferase